MGVAWEKDLTCRANYYHQRIMQPENNYIFSNKWLDINKAIWSQLLQQVNPNRILEAGSYGVKALHSSLKAWQISKTLKSIASTAGKAA